MRLVVHPGARVEGRLAVPGDKSIAHRWLILAATATGRSVLHEVPPSLDVRSTAACLAGLLPDARPALDTWCSKAARGDEENGFTWDRARPLTSRSELEVEGEGRSALVEPRDPLDCGNSGTTMRLLAGVLASVPVRATLVGDRSLMSRPMERVAEPLRAMGADVRTSAGHAPLEVSGARLRGISYRTPVPSAQLKSAVLLAGCAAEGTTEVRETVGTRDHTERALEALGAPIHRSPGLVRLTAFEHTGFEASVPGDVSSAAFLVGAAAVTSGRVEVMNVGLNPSRTAYLEVLGRMGVQVEATQRRIELGEPVGDLVAVGPPELAPTTVEPSELPLLIDEVPLLAAVAAHARGRTRFAGAGELRVKESDRLGGLAAGLVALGGRAEVQGDDLVVEGDGLRGGRTSSGGDHRMAMSMAVAGLAAAGDVEIDGAEAADVSFPGFLRAMRILGAEVEA